MRTLLHRVWTLAVGALACSAFFAGLAGATNLGTKPGKGTTAANTPPISTKAVTHPPAPPTLSPLQAAAGSVTVAWTDASVGELGFVVYRRDVHGSWQNVQQLRTRNTASTGDRYSWVDSSTSLSGQCYMVASTNSIGAGSSPEECTVRPDPSRFPQNVPAGAIQWTGLSSTNGGGEQLANQAPAHGYSAFLVYGQETFGVDLQLADQPSNWTIQAQGGPHLMDGQAVALEAAPGKWLAYGHETFGVDLVYSSTPSYEWYIVGGTPGSSIGSSGQFALWDSANSKYLIWSIDLDYGVDLDWSSAPAPRPVGSNSIAKMTMTAQPSVAGYVPFVGALGPLPSATVDYMYNPTSNPSLRLLETGHGPSDCGDSSDVVVLGPGEILAAAGLQTLLGSSTPTLFQRLSLLACAQTQATNLTLDVFFYTN